MVKNCYKYYQDENNGTINNIGGIIYSYITSRNVMILYVKNAMYLTFRRYDKNVMKLPDRSKLYLCVKISVEAILASKV